MNSKIQAAKIKHASLIKLLPIVGEILDELASKTKTPFEQFENIYPARSVAVSSRTGRIMMFNGGIQACQNYSKALCENSRVAELERLKEPNL